ncbi:Alpha/Beta hydrolase protein [Penicillium riverlandense]|uniref:Alpha/Beta hydrolase protein n=1 Tax=Penicillium riverlandense TaxID=1903569 RepID=UPI00254839EB|nr:Alpha/Beta hydrolase protein [Penicillium riverlandense]KAJ5815644.1 Alpha/Beta hydrolase protein [Penicillium riverlandense]
MESLIVNTSSDTTIYTSITRPAEHKNKPLVLFTHYWGGSSSTWHKLTSPYSSASISATYPTVAVDLRGWGKSTGPVADNGSAYSISAMASDICSVLKQLQARTEDLFENGLVFVGHSMGAKVAFATLSILPAELLNKVKGLVLAAPAPPTALNLPSEMKDQQLSAYQTQESVLWTLRNVLANPDTLSEQDMKLVVENSLCGNQFAKSSWPTYGMGEDISIGLRKTLESLKDVGLLVGIIVGEFDVVEPEERVKAEVGQFLIEIGLKVTIKTAKGVKHLIPLEDPLSIAQEIRRF